MPKAITLYRQLAFTICLLFCSTVVNAQQTQPYSRFQYHNYKWRAFHTTAFHIYFPEGYDSLCAAISKEIMPATMLVKKRMNTALQKAPNIIIYPSTDQLYESNIGAFELKDVTLPTFILKGNRLLLHYNGSYSDLKTELREAIVRATWEAQLNEGLEAQANSPSTVPYWMKEGMIRYFSTQWPVVAEDALLAVYDAKSPATWEAVIAANPALAGQAFCYFLATAYYPEVPAQLYFQLRKRKPLIRALRLITKTPADSLYLQCYDFYKARIGNVDLRDTLNRPLLTIPHKGRLLEVLANPKAEAFAYTVATWHKRTVYVYDLKAKTSSKVTSYQLPPWLNDHRADKYPIVQWSENGNDLLVTMPVKGKVSIKKYDRQGHYNGAYSLEALDGITHISHQGGNDYLLAAWRKAQSDIVSFNAGNNKYTPLTNDAYDDAEPLSYEKGKYLFFISERLIETDEKKKDSSWRHGLFIKNKEEIAPRIVSDIDYDQLHQPVKLPENGVMLTTTKYGRAQYANIGRGETHLVLARQPVQYLASTDEIISWQSVQDTLIIHKRAFDKWQLQEDDNKPSPWLNDYKLAAAARAKEDSLLKAAKDETPSFLEGVLSGSNAKERSAKRQDSIKLALQYKPSKSVPYILQLYSAYFTAKVNNDYFINRYQPYLNYQGQFKFPQLGGMAQGGFSDLFENHHFTVAYRLPAGTEGSDFFIKYNNTTSKTDWGLSYYRKTEDLKPDPKRNWVDENGRQYPNAAKVKTNYYEVSAAYPITYFSNASLSLAVRHDKTVFLATEKYSLDFPPIKSLWSLLTLSYNINKQQPTLPLLYKGFCGKATLDAFKGFTQSQPALAGISMKVEYHQPLYKYITLVTRLQAGYSGGSQSLLYNMGGVDNNITPRVDSNVHFAQDAPYAFQTLVSSLRGYYQNSIFGSRYGLFNADIYFPLFQTLIPVETPLQSINNLQLGLFFDMAIAGGERYYSTASPDSRIAYGLSARTTLAGYPLRFDIAWPGLINKPVWYLSLNIR